jgi:hypothetical protein
MLVAAAIDRVDQCVSCPGPRSSRVLVMTRPTCSSVIVCSPPAAHLKALQPRATNRDRYMVTVGRDTPSAAATCRFGVPSAHTQHNPRPQRQRLRRLAPARLRAGLLWRWPAYYSVKTAVGLVLLAGGRTAFALLGYS